MGIVGRAMQRARATALLAAAAKLAEHAQVLQDLLHGYLLAQEREVHLGTLGWLPRVGWLDSGRRRRYGDGGRGDHFLCGLVPFVAHGFVVGAGGGGAVWTGATLVSWVAPLGATQET